MLFPPLQPYNPANVRIRGGSINGVVIGNITPASGAFTTLSATGLLDISAATAGQIKFPATQNPSADANTLDDYEEGTYTPSLAGATTPGVQTYSVQVGRYRKVAGCVHVDGFIITTAKDAATAGNLLVSGMPFSQSAGAGFGFGIGIHGGYTMAGGGTQLGLFFNATGTSVNFAESGSGLGGAFIGAAGLGASTIISFGGWYPAA